MPSTASIGFKLALAFIIIMLISNASCHKRLAAFAFASTRKGFRQAQTQHSPLRNLPWSTRTTTTATTTSLFSSSPSSSSLSEQEMAELKERRKAAKQARKEAARAKRLKRMIGMPKAVDHGQYTTVYQPHPFQAQSGLPDRTRPFVVLGIESSCDDTGAAVVRSDGVILGEALASQEDIHAPWGGVVPGLARDAHEAQIDSVVETALREAGLTSAADVDGIAVTVGPGLEICLRVGATKARTLALEYDKPFCAVHHLEAHILMAGFVDHNNNQSNAGAAAADAALEKTIIKIPATPETHEASRCLDFPFLALLVSGGHCQLLDCQAVGRYRILGGTMDDSLGEALDKTARLLWGPGAGGGAFLEQWARRGDAQSVALPVPLRNKRKNCNFSYAGLKTAARIAAQALADERQVPDILSLPDADKSNLAASFQHAAFTHIEQRLQYALDQMEESSSSSGTRKTTRTLAVVGGVAANQELRSRLDKICQARGWQLVVPPPRYCTDQGAMSAWAGIERFWRGSSDDASSGDVYARYPFAAYDNDDDDNNDDNDHDLEQAKSEP